MNLTNEEKDYIKNKVMKNFISISTDEFEKIYDERNKLILSSDIFKHFEAEVFILLTNCGHPRTTIIDNFYYNIFEDVIVLKYNSGIADISYEKRFNLIKLNKSITCFERVSSYWNNNKYDSLFIKAFIEVKDLKTKRTRLCVINDTINKLNKEITTEYKNEGKNHIKILKDILPLLDTTYYPNYSK